MHQITVILSRSVEVFKFNQAINKSIPGRVNKTRIQFSSILL